MDLDDSAVSLASLLRLPDKLFVEASYKAILGRPADAGGMANYAAKVESGADKLRILVELATSAEGRLRTQQLEGIKEAIAKHAATSSLWARVVRRLRGNSSEQFATALRKLENKVLLLEREIQRRADESSELRSLFMQILFEQGKAELADDCLPSAETSVSGGTLSTRSASLANTFAALKISIANSKGG